MPLTPPSAPPPSLYPTLRQALDMTVASRRLPGGLRRRHSLSNAVVCDSSWRESRPPSTTQMVGAEAKKPA